MKAKLILIISICAMPILSKGQYLQSNTSSTYFFNSNQAMPVFAGNDDNWNVKSTLRNNGFDITNINNWAPTLGIETYLPKLHSAVYFFGTRETLGAQQTSVLNAGVSPRFKLKNGLTILSNLSLQHQSFSLQSDWVVFPDPSWVKVSKARYLDLGIGTGFIFKGFYLSSQMTNVLNTKAYVYETTPQNAQKSRTLTSLRFMTGKTHRFNERFALNGSLSFQKLLRTPFTHTMAISTTLKYRWFIGAVSLASDNLNVAVGAEIKNRISLIYNHARPVSRVSRGGSGTHQIGISYNITKPNQDHQLLPLLSMF